MEGTHVGVIGLAVMGANLAQNIESRGYSVGLHNRTTSVTQKFVQEHAGKKFVPSTSLADFVEKLQSPRQIIIMVKAGKPVDELVEGLLPLLKPGDIIIDGGNAHYADTTRREAAVRAKGVRFLGLGISGGEEGARLGPSLMPGGAKEAWEITKPLLEAIAARVDDEPCVTYIGPGGAGHFVKMVHNGIEYADMQLIAETYDILHTLARRDARELADTFTSWNSGPLASFLIEITGKILATPDDRGSGLLVEKILDKAGQKGTGRWTVEVALEHGVPIPTITGAVDARALSALKDERKRASPNFSRPFCSALPTDITVLAHDALYAAKILAYAQGMALIQRASRGSEWGIPLAEVAAIWRGGCIIRARLLKEITAAFRQAPELDNLVLAPAFRTLLAKTVPALRQCVSLAAMGGIPVLAHASALSYFDSYSRETLPQNLTQAQRDFFGAHTYERTDQPGTFHTNWPG